MRLFWRVYKARNTARAIVRGPQALARLEAKRVAYRGFRRLLRSVGL